MRDICVGRSAMMTLGDGCKEPSLLVEGGESNTAQEQIGRCHDVILSSRIENLKKIRVCAEISPGDAV